MQGGRKPSVGISGVLRVIEIIRTGEEEEEEEEKRYEVDEVRKLPVEKKRRRGSVSAPRSNNCHIDDPTTETSTQKVRRGP